MKTKRILLPVIIILSLAFVFDLFLAYENKTIVTTEIEISDEKIPESFDGYRIVQLSDFHNTEFGFRNKRLLKKIRKAEPDIIVITGDMIDMYRPRIKVALHLGEELVSIAPTYFVSGNHDIKTAGREIFFAGLKEAKVNILRNRNVILEKDGESIRLIGIDDQKFLDDYMTGTDEENIRNIISLLIKNQDEDFKILLAHRPEWMDVYASVGVDLVMTGHAHGGQINIPFKGGLVAPTQGWFPEYYEGVYEKENTRMIVNRGLGNSAFPFRINNRPEIVVTELKSE